ncbi:MAG: hypothetical protein A07HR60_01750 [uncultured archaeon A07HR60]|nr:MAG: hypothetical protein A07HR60_01750 [uncultured archaeon A07HR60]
MSDTHPERVSCSHRLPQTGSEDLRPGELTVVPRISCLAMLGDYVTLDSVSILSHSH